MQTWSNSSQKYAIDRMTMLCLRADVQPMFYINATALLEMHLMWHIAMIVRTVFKARVLRTLRYRVKLEN